MKGPTRAVVAIITIVVILVALFQIGIRTMKARERTRTPSCASHLKMYALGMQQYIHDYDNTFPPMRTADELEPRILPYIKNPVVFTCPFTMEHYQPNAALSGRRLRDIKDPADRRMLFDAAAHPRSEYSVEGGIVTAYVDGHVRGYIPSSGGPARP